MKCLVIGSGGREHALAWKLAQSPAVEAVYCAPGNAGIAADAHCVPIGVGEHEKLLAFARDNAIDLTVVGPEVPLCEGVVDLFKAHHLRVFGPGKQAAQLEGSKVYAKEFMARHHLPTADWKAFTEPEPCYAYIRDCFAQGARGLVVKADGLAAGKGVTVAFSLDEVLAAARDCFEGAFGKASLPVLIEQLLEGDEMSVLALIDTKSIVPLRSAQDYKRLRDGDQGPNTGGMGNTSPMPQNSEALQAVIREQVLLPFLAGVQSEKLDYHGLIFIGLMITADGPKILEFNVRFGDPETQSVLPRLKSDLGAVFNAVIDERLAEMALEWDERACCCVIMASGGYPGAYEKGHVITGLDEAEQTGCKVFHAGTALKEGHIVNAGGRVLGVTALGSTIAEAAKKAYGAVAKIQWKDCIYRRDIGSK